MDNQSNLAQQSSFPLIDRSPYIQTATITISLDIQPDSLNVSLYPSYANTFVLIQKNKSQYYTPIIYIKHINHSGKVLKQHYLGKLDFIKTKMMTDRHAIFQVFNRQQSDFSIIQWNLENNQIIKLKCGNVWYNEVFLFSETKLICVIQRWNKNSDSLSSNMKLSVSVKYFTFPLQSQKDQPIIYLRQDHCISFYDEPKKFNYHSGIIWTKKKMEDKYGLLKLDYSFVHILDLREQQKKIRSFRLDNPFNDDKIGIQSIITDVWQINTCTFYVRFRMQGNIRGITQNDQKQRIQTQKNIKKQKYNELIWDRKKKTLRKLHLLTDKLPKDNNYIIQFSNGLRILPQIIIPRDRIKNLHNQYPYAEQSPKYHRLAQVLHIDVDSLKIICIQRFEKYYSELFYPEYNHHLYVRIQKLFHRSEKTKKINFQVQFYRIPQIDRKIITAFMVSQLIQNCDEGLVDKVIELIQDNVWNQQVLQLSWKTSENLQMLADYQNDQKMQQFGIDRNIIDRGKEIWNQIYKKVKQTIFDKQQQ